MSPVELFVVLLPVPALLAAAAIGLVTAAQRRTRRRFLAALEGDPDVEAVPAGEVAVRLSTRPPRRPLELVDVAAVGACWPIDAATPGLPALRIETAQRWPHLEPADGRPRLDVALVTAAGPLRVYGEDADAVRALLERAAVRAAVVDAFAAGVVALDVARRGTRVLVRRAATVPEGAAAEARRALLLAGALVDVLAGLAPALPARLFSADALVVDGAGAAASGAPVAVPAAARRGA